MGLLWWRNKSKTDESSGPIDTGSSMPDDLADYLETKESQLSNREFKALLRRQSANATAVKEQQEGEGVDTGANFLSMIQAKQPDEVNKEENGKIEVPKLPTPVSTASAMKRPREYLNYELEKYRRENDEKESVLTNCSEIQYAFYQCLGKQKIWDRVSAVASLNTDECTKLADFFMACTEIQKKAFILFDYSSLDSIEEMKDASKSIDVVFSNTFKNIEDVQDKEKFLSYTKELRNKREDFYVKYNK